jgi:predicted DNA-binding transcriptional regulator AlpA
MLHTRYRLSDLSDHNIADSHTQVGRLIKDHGFPEGRRAPGTNVVYWLAHEVNAWLEAQPPASETKPKPKGAVRMRAAGEFVRPKRTRAQMEADGGVR